MADQKLFDSLAKLGLPLFETSEELEINAALAEVVKSREPRLWAGFPVLLANAGERYAFSRDRVEQLLPSREQREDFQRLVIASLALYASYHLRFSWADKLGKALSEEDKSLLKQWRTRLDQERPLQWNRRTLDPERLKETFELYFRQSADDSRQKQEKLEGFSLEYALSQVFSPKQKELFRKKLDGLPMTKTEREYYSRTVRKKVVALANSELHSLARKLLEQ